MKLPIFLYDVLADLYSSEINFSITCFSDRGFCVKLGYSANGPKDWNKVNTWVPTLQEVTAVLTTEAIKHYPNSEFAKKYTILLKEKD